MSRFFKFLVGIFLFTNIAYCDSFTTGLNAYNNKDYKKAFVYFKKSCDSNDIFACRYLGYMYKNSLGVFKNREFSYNFFKKACDGGDMVACVEFAHIMIGNYNIESYLLYIPKEAKEILEKACYIHKYGGACLSLGVLLYESVYINNEKNEEKAKNTFKKGCEYGFENSCMKYDEYVNPYKYAEKSYKQNDFKNAAKYFGRGCNNDDAKSCDMLAYMYQYAKGVKKDINKSIELYIKACDKESFNSCISVGNIYNIKSEYKEAYNYYKKACDKNVAKACYLLGTLHINENTYSHFNSLSQKENLKLFVQFNKKACELGYNSGCN